MLPLQIFPGVGSFGAAMRLLRQQGYAEPLKAYVEDGRPFLGICIGLQVLFQGSEETPGVEGLGVIPSTITRFDASAGPVPHMGWNGLSAVRPGAKLLEPVTPGSRVYFVHSYRATPSAQNAAWVMATSDYGGPFVAAVGQGSVVATQFHPEKSGALGLKVMERFLTGATDVPAGAAAAAPPALVASVASGTGGPTRLAKRVIACMDVRANDRGDLVVTKGDQYDVREKGGDKEVRNLGKPVDLARRYFEGGADEVTFLNITGFRNAPLTDAPMLEVLRRTSETVFVPLTVGGGIKAYTDGTGREFSALEVASEYFRCEGRRGGGGEGGGGLAACLWLATKCLGAFVKNGASILARGCPNNLLRNGRWALGVVLAHMFTTTPPFPSSIPATPPPFSLMPPDDWTRYQLRRRQDLHRQRRRDAG